MRSALLAGCRRIPLVLGLAAAPALLPGQTWQPNPGNGHYYTVLGPGSFAAADAAARSLGGALATVRSRAENDWLVRAFGARVGTRAWLGLNDRAVEGTFVWTSGSTAAFRSFAPGEPNGGTAENAVAIDFGSNGDWRDQPEQMLLAAIVELAGPPAAAGSSEVGAGCANPLDNRVPRLQVPSPPLLGGTAIVLVDRAPPLQLGFLLLGTKVANPPLPVPPPFDLPGCLVRVDPAAAMAFFAATSLSGTASFSFAVPAVPVAHGLSLVLQHATLLPVQGQLKVVLSNGARLVLGGPSAEIELAETFADEAGMDRDRSAGSWAGGRGTFGSIGGDGEHGDFDVALATPIGQVGGLDTYVLDTDNTVIPAIQARSAHAILVSDGRFAFASMVVPANVRLRFTGQSPPQFTVRGRLQIDGVLENGGEDVAFLLLTGTTMAGQPGGRGGTFGGAGGQGGDRCLGNGASPAFDGRNGADVRVLAGHAFAGSVAGTGGRGSTMFPASGLTTSLTFPGAFTISYCAEAAAGGGGGGFSIAGATGLAVTNNIPDPITGVPPRLSFLGPAAPGGAAFNLLPVPAGARSSLHFLVGGAGGGGGGSEALFTINLARTWAAGCGGGGGGGALALRAGHLLRVAAAASVDATGGSAGDSPTTNASTPTAAPGGGGAGGSVLLQTGGIADVQGAVDVNGGRGGLMQRQAPSQPPAGAAVTTRGGDGSHGSVRLEAPGSPTLALLPNAVPAAARGVAPLAEVDDRSGCQSLFQPTRLPADPTFLRYEIDALVNGVATRFSDDPAAGIPAGTGAAIAVWFQGARFDAAGNLLPGSERPWRTMVGRIGTVPALVEDGVNGFRFQVVIDRTVGASVELRRVAVVYRP